MDNHEERFHLPWTSPVLLVAAGFYAALAAYAWPYEILVAVVLVKGIFIVMVLRIAIRLTVSEQGFRINWFKRATWAEVATVRRTSFLGLPYLLVTLRAGLNKYLPLWIPLYVRGARTVEAALAERAPINNPLKVYADSAIHA